MGTFLASVFIVATAALAIWVGTRPTRVDGRAIAASLAERLREHGISVECDREIRLGPAGAKFACTHTGHGQRARIQYAMTRDGRYAPVAPLP